MNKVRMRSDLAEESMSVPAGKGFESYDSFDDRYLGAKSSAPSVDNDGNALLTGAIYWNTTGRIYIAENVQQFVVGDVVTIENVRQHYNGSKTITAVRSTPNNLAFTSTSLTKVCGSRACICALVGLFSTRSYFNYKQLLISYFKRSATTKSDLRYSSVK